MSFCVFLNSRGRVDMLNYSLNSLIKNARNLSCIKILVRIDDDDKETVEFSQNYFHSNVRFIVGARPTNLIQSYNDLIKKEEADWYFVWNDDCLMLTEEWDQKFLDCAENFKKLNQIKDNILLLGCADTSVDRPPGKIYASFMAIHKDAVREIGFFMDERFVTLGADSHIDSIYRALGRVVDAPILVDHIYHASLYQVLNPDIVAAEYRAKAWINSPNPFNIDNTEVIEKLRNYIENLQ